MRLLSLLIGVPGIWLITLALRLADDVTKIDLYLQIDRTIGKWCRMRG